MLRRDLLLAAAALPAVAHAQPAFLITPSG